MSLQKGGPRLLASQCLSINSNYYNKLNNCACRRNMSMFETISLVLIYATSLDNTLQRFCFGFLIVSK